MKLMIYAGASIGGLIGGYIPVLFFHMSGLSGWSLLCGGLGTVVGLWAGVKLANSFEI